MDVDQLEEDEIEINEEEEKKQAEQTLYNMVVKEMPKFVYY